jgi:signal peptide peptidase SppA
MTRNNLLPYVGIHDAFWAIEESSARMLLGILGSTDARVHKEEFEARRGGDPIGHSDFDLIDGVAVISIVGAMTKSPTSFDPGCSTVLTRRQIRAAAADDAVRAIVLRIDSPGGSVGGTDDLAADVAAAAKKKPCHAYVEDSCCSAAYWVASQCTKIFASPTSVVGSIGVFTTATDWSRAAENMGAHVHLITTGKHKGAGAPGTRISEEHLAKWQSTCDVFYEHFMQAIRKGRRMSKARVEELADGSVWVGESAVSNGLIDGIASFDEVFSSLSRKRSKEGERLSADNGVPPMVSEIDEPSIQVSSEDEPHAGKTLAEESALALAAVHGLTNRIADLREDRKSEGRRLSQKAIGHANEVLQALGEATDALASAIAEEPDPRSQLAQALLRSSLGEAASI